MLTHDQFVKKLLKKPEVKAEYAAQAEEFALLDELLRAQARQGLFGPLDDIEAEVGVRRIDALCKDRCLHQWPQRPAEDDEVNANEHKEDRNDHPGDMGQELGDDIVDQHVTMRLVLGDLHP